MDNALSRPVTRALLVVAAWLLVGGGAARAQSVPQTVSFAARLEQGGAPLQGTHDFEFALFTAPSGGSFVWAEAVAGLSVSDGLVDVELGTVAALAGIFGGGTLYLEVTVDGTTLAPRAEITSVPYAMLAGDAQRLGNVPASGYLRTGSTMACAGTDKVVGIDAATGNVVCGADDGGQTYFAGQGLQLGSNTFSLMTCAAGQILRMSGGGGAPAAWGCADLVALTGITTDSFSGLVSAVDASGGVDLRIKPCGPMEVLHWNSLGGQQGWFCDGPLYGVGTSPGSGIRVNLGDNVLIDEGNAWLAVDFAVAQKRVTGTCTTGQTITAIKQDGTVTCAQGPAFKAAQPSGTIAVGPSTVTLHTLSATLPAGGYTEVSVEARWNNLAANPADRIHCTLTDLHNGLTSSSTFDWDPGDADNNTDTVAVYTRVSTLPVSGGLHTYTVTCNALGSGASPTANSFGTQIRVHYYPEMLP
jgi:hypothetical protein